MKKVLCICVLAVVLITALALPSFAASSTTLVDYDGHNLPKIDSILVDEMTPYAVIVLHEGETKLVVQDEAFWLSGGSGLYYLKSSNNNRVYVLNDGSWISTEEYLNNTIAISNIFSIYWTSHDLYYGPTLVFPYVEPVLPKCDGSCGVPDSNLDGICDDCGALFSLRSTGMQYVETVTLQSASGTIYVEYTSNEPFTISGRIYGSTYRVEPSIPVNCVAFLNGEITYQGLVATHYPSYNLEDIVIGSTFEWYDEDGTLFFPKPLWEMVEGVTQGTLSTEAVGVHSTMMILTLCGVGLVALLIGLSLLVKVLPRFLKR